MLHTRNSVNLLSEPGPSAAQLKDILKAGLRACDHKNLRPWKFLTIEGDARQKFGKLMADVKAASEGCPLSIDLRLKIESKPLRAPLIIVVVASITEHPNVPEVEQVLSAGASAQMMMTAAHALGVGAIWRSGNMMFRPEMKAGLGLLETDQIVGYLYLGTPKAVKPLPELELSDFVHAWTGA